jgi:hypothetical protein
MSTAFVSWLACWLDRRLVRVRRTGCVLPFSVVRAFDELGIAVRHIASRWLHQCRNARPRLVLAVSGFAPLEESLKALPEILKAAHAPGVYVTLEVEVQAEQVRKM